MSGVALRALTDGVFAYGQSNRRVFVLRAYFDDSGTHAGSDAIVMGGLIAHEDDWAAFEPKWAEALAEFQIPKMHMNKCMARPYGSPFYGWSDAKRDAAIARFGAIIIEMDALVVASALSRAEWAAAVAERAVLSIAFDEPIDFCFNDCIQRAARYGRRSAGYPEPVVITFDARQESLARWGRRAAGYQAKYPDKIAGIAFGSMKQVLPLQAADMVANGAFCFHIDRGRVGAEPEPRDGFRPFVEGLQFAAGFFTTAQLIEYADRLQSDVSGSVR